MAGEQSAAPPSAAADHPHPRLHMVIASPGHCDVMLGCMMRAMLRVKASPAARTQSAAPPSDDHGLAEEAQGRLRNLLGPARLGVGAHALVHHAGARALVVDQGCVDRGVAPVVRLSVRRERLDGAFHGLALPPLRRERLAEALEGLLFAAALHPLLRRIPRHPRRARPHLGAQVQHSGEDQHQGGRGRAPGEREGQPGEDGRQRRRVPVDRRPRRELQDRHAQREDVAGVEREAEALREALDQFWGDVAPVALHRLFAFRHHGLGVGDAEVAEAEVGLSFVVDVLRLHVQVRHPLLVHPRQGRSDLVEDREEGLIVSAAPLWGEEAPGQRPVARLHLDVELIAVVPRAVVPHHVLHAREGSHGKHLLQQRPLPSIRPHQFGALLDRVGAPVGPRARQEHRAKRALPELRELLEVSEVARGLDRAVQERHGARGRLALRGRQRLR
mmetsp:Transcript_10666/g.25928  ORF Transcript_10666/g.25928 Transcript_10666/m.25928 type:complete len:445 (-) Transcript_10666:792-2126(-)